MANKEVSFNLGLGATPETTDEKLYPEMTRMYNSVNALATQLDKYCGRDSVRQADRSSSVYTPARTHMAKYMNRIFLPTSVDITAGLCVNITNVAGVPTARLSNPTTGQYAMGWVETSTVAGEYAEIFTSGLADVFTGLLPGRHYYCALNGLITTTFPVSPDERQVVGMAVTSGILLFGQSCIEYG
jgi:hypothetical protein